jgi:predicted nucleotide-binding protein (sugar kinase/HSP70/actin superfamily)
MAITSIIEEVDGVIALGPFGCMPSRIAEAVASTSISGARLETAENRPLVERVLKEYPSLPFLAIETDGNRMTQSVEAKIEAFCLQVQRVHEESRRFLEPSAGAARQHR